MTHEYAWPSSLNLEIEAQRMHATPRPAGWADLAPAMALSRFPQAFDAFVWIIASALVFPAAFFPMLDPASGVAAGLTVGALAYVARPLALPLFGLVRERHGRGVKLTAARCLLGAATAAVAFLPDAAHAGLAAALLLAGCRLAQGVAMAGTSNQTAQQGPLSGRENRIWRAAVWALAGLAGLAAASGLFAILASAVDTADFIGWGWRYPFLMAIAANTVALFADLRLVSAERPPAADEKAVRLVTLAGRPVDDTAA